jgi:hypothetical protein
MSSLVIVHFFGRLVDVLTAFRHRPDVQVFGLMNLAKLEFPEDSDSGAAHPGGLAALGYALNVLPAYKDNEAVQVLYLCVGVPEKEELLKKKHGRRACALSRHAPPLRLAEQISGALCLNMVG